jgi:hypothetical protein
VEVHAQEVLVVMPEREGEEEGAFKFCVLLVVGAGSKGRTGGTL